MKNSITILMMIFMVGPIAFSQVGINTTSPDASAVLDVYGTDKGFLPPRLDDSQIAALNSLGANGGPATGLVVYNTSVDCLQVNKGTPTNPDWVCLQSGGTGGGGGITIVNGVCTLPQVPQDSGDSSIDGGTDIVDLPSPTTSQIWMDRNLGAAAPNANGGYYQFGRGKDGHEDPNSTVIFATSIASSVIPGHGDFIAGNVDPEPAFQPDQYIHASHSSWIDIGHVCDAALYQNGNDPCPDGYRIPTVQEWENEFPSSMSAAQKEAHWNALGLPNAGFRRGTNSPGVFTAGETAVMASDIDSNQSIVGNAGLILDSHFALVRRSATTLGIESTREHAQGNQIRCIKE